MSQGYVKLFMLFLTIYFDWLGILLYSLFIHSKNTLVPEVFLEPRESCEAVKMSPEAVRREEPLVTLDLSLTFMQTPGSGSDPGS